MSWIEGKEIQRMIARSIFELMVGDKRKGCWLAGWQRGVCCARSEVRASDSGTGTGTWARQASRMLLLLLLLHAIHDSEVNAHISTSALRTRLFDQSHRRVRLEPLNLYARAIAASHCALPSFPSSASSSLYAGKQPRRHSTLRVASLGHDTAQGADGLETPRDTHLTSPQGCGVRQCAASN